MDTSLQSLVNLLLGELQKKSDVTLQALDQQRENQNAALNNTANTRGLLRSGFPTVRQTMYLGQKYMPAYADTRQKLAQEQLKMNDSIRKSIDQIDAMNEAARRLGSM